MNKENHLLINVTCKNGTNGWGLLIKSRKKSQKVLRIYKEMFYFKKLKSNLVIIFYVAYWIFFRNHKVTYKA